MHWRAILSRLRTLLVLGRVSNLPTVWTNCLAGWWLGGGENFNGLACGLFGTSFLYIGGMFLNDAFDADFDRRFRQERPIPAALISSKTVWIIAIALLAAGAGPLLIQSSSTAVLTTLLVLCIVAYDALHKYFVVAPVLMGGCRLLVYLVAASLGADGVRSWAIWGGVVLGIYIVGVTYMARVESTRRVIVWWPVMLLFVPVVLALVMNVGVYRPVALVLSTLVSAWLIWCLTAALKTNPNPGVIISNLLAGISLLDLLAALDFPTPWIAIFPLCFVLAKGLQRLVPAT